METAVTVEEFDPFAPPENVEEFDIFAEVDGIGYAESGEIVAMPEFCIDTPEKLDWWLERLSNFDSQVSAKKLQLASVQERLETDIRQIERRRESLYKRFEREAQEVVGELIEGGKAKSVNRAFGKLGWRTLPTRVEALVPLKVTVGEVSDDRALAWASEHCPEAVRLTTEVQVSKLPKDPEKLDPSLFVLHSGEQKFFVTTV